MDPNLKNAVHAVQQQLENCLQKSPASAECKMDSGEEASGLLRELQVGHSSSYQPLTYLTVGLKQPAAPLQDEHLAFKSVVVTKAFGLASKALRGQVHSSGRSMLVSSSTSFVIVAYVYNISTLELTCLKIAAEACSCHSRDSC